MKNLMNSLANMANALSRAEMKNIIAGSGSLTCGATGLCRIVCRNCSNPTCEGWGNDCSAAVYQCCGSNPGGASCTGPSNVCGGTC